MTRNPLESLTLNEVSEGDELPELRVHVTATTVVLGALASRDWRPMHHDREFAMNRNGLKDIFMNTPNNAAWFERYITDWTGPKGRLGRMKFRMIKSIFPDDLMILAGHVNGITIDDVGCGWLNLAIAACVDSEVASSCQSHVALPVDYRDNPWSRKGKQWRP